MNIAMVGTGYVGLVSGACFSEYGAHVTCVDKVQDKIAALVANEVPIYEPGLRELIRRNVDSGRLSFTTELSAAVAEADLVFIAVGTPSRHGDGHADLKYVYAAAEEIAGHLRGYTVVVNKSTVPVGTAREVHRIISKCNPEAEFDIASNPEFLREGSALADFMRPDRIVIGVNSDRAENLLRELYRPLSLNEGPPLIATSLESAELTKYAANAFLATKISFINEISQLCEKTGADVQAVARGMGLDGRIGRKFLHAGPGYGGSCFPKDTRALIRIAQENDVSCRIVEAVAEVNASQKAHMVAKIRTAMNGSVADKVLAVLGLTFKPETDDMRDAPSLTIIPALLDKGAIIRAHDPQGMHEARKLLPDSVTFADTIKDAVTDADAVILMTEWNQYRGMKLRKLKKLMRGDSFIDLRNVYEPKNVTKAGLDYICVGR